jgi:hypothetical protein
MKLKANGLGLGRWLLILMLALAPLLTGCGYLAAGAAGGIIGHAIAYERLSRV